MPCLIKHAFLLPRFWLEFTTNMKGSRQLVPTSQIPLCPKPTTTWCASLWPFLGFYVGCNANFFLSSRKTNLHSLFIYFEQWCGHLMAQGNLLPCGSQMKLPINNTLLSIQKINIGILLISWHYFYNFMAFFNWHLRGVPPPEHPINFALDFHPLPFSGLQFPRQLNMSISPIRIARH